MRFYHLTQPALTRIYKKTQVVLVVLILSALQKICTAQNLYFQSYSAKEGLSQNSVYSASQTNDGFMWFGTQDGLNRFDGRNFTVIQPSNSATGSGKNYFGKFSKMYTALYADTRDWLWVGTTQEIALYNRYTNQFILPGEIYKGFSVPGGIWINKITEDNRGNIWIVTQKNGLFCYNKALQSMVSFKWTGGQPEKIIALSTGATGDIWACSENEVYLLQKSTFHPIGLKDKLSLKKIIIGDMCMVNGQLWLIINAAGIIIVQPLAGNSFTITDFSKTFSGKNYLTDARLIHQSDSNTVWVGSRSEGLIKVNLSAKTFENAGALGTSYSLKRQFVLTFFTNRQKITWIGLSGGGIAKYDLQKIQFSLWRTAPLPQQPVPDNMLFSVFSPDDELFYMGTLYGGLLQLNIKNGRYQYHQPPAHRYNESGAKNIYEVIAGEKNLLWMATWSGLYSFDKVTRQFVQYTDNNDAQTSELCAVIKLRQQPKLLVGGYQGKLRIFNLKTHQWEQCKEIGNGLNKLELRVRYMKEMEDGNIFISTETQNLVQYNYITGAIVLYPQFQNISGVSRHFCRSGSFLWIATDDGLIQASAATMQVVKLWNTDNGLPNHYIYAVVPDNYGRIWISSNAGLAVLDYQSGTCKKFTEEDGLQGMEFNTASCYKNQEGKIWFGGINGLSMVDPELSAANQYSPAPLITGINVMNNPYQSDTAIPYIRRIVLPNTKNFISFEFQSPDFSQSENIMYEYMLKGVDTGWVKNGTKTYASYTQLKPGHYTFQVKSANTNFVWSKAVTTLDITIVPPWYNTWWFYLFTVAVIGLLLLWFVVNRIRRIRHEANLKQQITETEMAALKAQMNPHFMFNCINSIDAFIQSNDKYNATLYLNKFAKLIRNVLDSSRQNVVYFSKDIETLKLYIELEELRNENKFTTQLTIDEELLNSDYKVPPLIVQPFVENAIIHGLRNREGNEGELIVTISKSDTHIIYTISDNGIGRKQSEKVSSGKEKSYGIQMSYDRIKLFNKEETASVTIDDLYDQQVAAGTRVIVNLKLV